MDNTTEKSLNSLLQGEYMAVDSFNIFISKLQNQKYRDVFQDVQKQHRDNISTLAEYIQNIGGKPDENLGFKGNMADIKINFDMYKKNDNYIKNKAIEGETNGINMTEKIMRGNLDNKSRDIVGEILHRDRNSIERLKELN
ncbi:DUF2383 domain-containing protein [Clostridium sp. D2Q-11]|uniref:DUF2383 domain-containing protein n=1 Tax=Anaeromonas frigoriresistens TaxID=2683708 RepID=A0A942UT69_9FIRM|nr:DUF2383 domain-containing protein [Anaeromonas frigoriresistens]MBS4538683.1 DUF2383 domain-containing protein [Anaeromonas frigoriresistens]